MTTRWHYACRDGSTPNSSAEFTELWTDLVIPSLNACQAPSVTNLSVRAFKVGTGGDDNMVILSGGGTYAADEEDCLPPFLTCGLKWGVDPDQAGTRVKPIERGFTRISGLADDMIELGQLTTAYKTGVLQDFVDNMLVGLPVSGDTYHPAIIFWENSTTGEWKEAWVDTFNGAKVGTQNTRKVY